MLGRMGKTGSRTDQGYVLITALLLLLVLTILGISLFRSFGLEEKIAGNTREKTRARLAAESALQYAEWWLTQGNNTANDTDCTSLLNANLNQSAVCTNALTSMVSDVTAVPWSANGADIGVQYTPPGLTVSGDAGGANAYYEAPRYYISLVGMAKDGQGVIYRIDAEGFGGTPDAVAEVEATYELGTGVQNLGGE